MSPPELSDYASAYDWPTSSWSSAGEGTVYTGGGGRTGVQSAKIIIFFFYDMIKACEVNCGTSVVV